MHSVAGREMVWRTPTIAITVLYCEYINTPSRVIGTIVYYVREKKFNSPGSGLQHTPPYLYLRFMATDVNKYQLHRRIIIYSLRFDVRTHAAVIVIDSVCCRSRYFFPPRGDPYITWPPLGNLIITVVIIYQPELIAAAGNCSIGVR